MRYISKWHDKEFIVAISRVESGLIHVVWVNTYLMVAVLQVDLAEELGSQELVKELFNVG